MMLFENESLKLVIAPAIVTIDRVEKFIKRFASACEKHSCKGQIVQAGKVCSFKHALHASEQAWQAVREESALSKGFESEVLLRLAGTGQLRQALAFLGVKEGRQEAVIIIAGKDCKECLKGMAKAFKLKADDRVLEENLGKHFSKLKQAFNVSDAELESLSDLGREQALEACILERVALVALEEKR